MKAGETSIDVNQKVKIIRNKHGEREDNLLIGCIGTVTHPFAFGECKKGWVGIYLDENTATKITSMYGDRLNVHESEISLVKD